MLRESASATSRVTKMLARDPGRLWIAVRGAARVGFQIIKDPHQLDYLQRWIPTVERTTLDLSLPWLPFQIIDRLDQVLTRESRVFEYGGGGSTLWLAQRAGKVVTVEHDPEWADALLEHTADLPNVTLLVRSADDNYADYVPAIDDYPDEHFDVVVVDGRQRVRCFERALPKVRPGGMLLLDDSERSRYASTFELGRKHRHVTIRGLAPSKSKAAQTTVWLPRATATAS